MGSTVRCYLDAATLLLRFEEAQQERHSPLARFAARPVETEMDTIRTSAGSTRARRYVPSDARRPPGLVLAHGVHPEGIDEPRFRHLAEVLASAGLAVLTPELEPLTRYRISASTVGVIGESARWLATDLQRPAVGLVGISFGGGLALLTAAERAHAPHVASVLAIGAHHDIGRVLRWFAGASAKGPDGERPPVEPHTYGIGLSVFAHLERYFDEPDRPIARSALSHLLVEHEQRAASFLPMLSSEGRAQLERIMGRRERSSLERAVQAALDTEADALDAVSPRGKLTDLGVPVYLLHGVGDPVIPSTETRWLAREVPPRVLEQVVVTAFLDHAEQVTELRLRERFRLVQLMARVLGAARRARGEQAS